MANVKIPKRVGGVKIPKKVRRQVKKAVRVAESPVVREVAAAALGAAAQAKAARADIRAARAEARSAPEGDGPTVRLGGERFVEAVRAAAIDGLRRFIEGLEEGLRELERGAGADDADRAPRANGRRAGASAD